MTSMPKGLKGKRPLYGLPGLLSTSTADVVTVVSGEKCVHAARAAWPGVAALVTTWSGGDAGWCKTDWAPLSGRTINLVADADESGRKATKAIAAHLHGMHPSNRFGW